MTFSRSTSTNCCGTAGRNVLTMPAISLRFCAAAMNLFRLSARNWTSFPARSSSTNVNPPEVPTPGIDGGGVGELKMQEQIALIFIRQEARGNLACKVSRGSAEGDQHYKRDRAFSNQRSRPVYILIRDASKDAIEQIEEFRQRAAAVRL